MEKLNELRMTLIILVIGLFFLGGCFFSNKYTVNFKTNGGTAIKEVLVEKGDKLAKPKTPKKDGYEFVGWYVDGKRYNFSKKVNDDITLVAKWKKIEKEESTTTTSAKKTTTKKTTFTKKKTTKKSTSKKTSTTKKNTSTKTSTTTSAVTVATTSSTTTTTTSFLEPTTITTSSITVTTTTQVITTTTKVVPMNIKITEEEVELSFEVSEEESNVESNIDINDYEKFMLSDKNNWLITSNNGYDYQKEDITFEDNILKLKGDISLNSLSIYDGENSFVIEHDEVVDKWFIKYPTVRLVSGLNVRYFNNLNTAIKLADKNAEITLMGDQIITEELVIKNSITIEGRGYEIISESPYLFKITELIDEECVININNFKGAVKNFMFLSNNVIKEINLSNLNISYEERITNEDIPEYLHIDETNKFLNILGKAL